MDTKERIKILVEDFSKNRNKWTKQNDILDLLEPLITPENIEVLKNVIGDAATTYVEQRIVGTIRRIENTVYEKLPQDQEPKTNINELTSVLVQSNQGDEPNAVSISNETFTPAPTIDPTFIFNIHELSDVDKRFIIDFIKKFKDFSGISIKSLKPGFSGSGVFMIFPIKKISESNYRIRPKAWIVKLGKIEKLKKEYDNAYDAATRSSSHIPELKTEEGQDRACLIQEIASNFFDEETISFKKMVWPDYKLRHSPTFPSLDSVQGYLNQLHKEIKSWNAEKNLVSKPFTEATKIVYEQIDEKRLYERLRLLEINPLKTTLEHFGSEFVNPVWYYTQLRKINPPISYCEQPLHGDLHTENIQIDSGNIAHFIDWGNSGIGHAAIDYCALETSVWAHCLPNDYMIKDIDLILKEIPLDRMEFRYKLEKINEFIPILRCREIIKMIRNNAYDIIERLK